MIGSTVEQYQILEQLGGGGMGQVYRALDLELDREVAIKCVRPELASLKEVTQRFRTEARTLAKLSHPNIATVYRFFDHAGQLFLVMELIQGRPFGRMLLEEGAQSPQQVVTLVHQALTGLGYAHEHNVVHRDIKPGNLMLAGSDVVKVLDFGIAHLLDGDTRLTRAGSVVGTPAYMAPEQVLGRAVDQRTDLYSLGIVLYEMLTGKLPFEANSDFEVMQAKLEQEPRPLGNLGPAIPEALQSTINQALAKDMSDRFQSAEQFANSLHSSLNAPSGHFSAKAEDPEATTVILPLESTSSSSSATDNQQPIKLYALAAAGALLIALAALFLGGDAQVEPVAQVDGPGAPEAIHATPPLDSEVRPSQNPVQLETASIAPQGKSTPVRVLDSSQSVEGQTVLEPAEPPANASSAAPSVGPSAGPSTTLPTKPPSTSSSGRSGSPTLKLPPKSTSKPKLPASYEVRAVKVSTHKTQKTGRFSRAAGYNGSFVLSGPMGDSSEIALDEVIEVRQDGQLLLREQVGSDTRQRGRFGTKKRVQELKLLPIGSYDVRLVFENQGKPVGRYDWKLKVVD